MADPTKAWHAVFDKGSKQAQERLKKAHGHKPEFQAFLKSRGAEGGERSVTQASTSLKKATGAKLAAQKIADMRYKKALQASSERVKEMGRRRRESGEGLGGGLESNKDIIAHVKQHGSIKAGRLGEAVKPDASMAMTDELKRKMITDKDKQTLGKIATLMASQKNKDKKNEYVRQLGLKAMKSGKVDPARGHIPTRAGREELKKEEVQVDEANMRFDYEAAARPKSSDVKNFLNRNKNARAAAASNKYIRRMTKLGGLGPNQTKKDTEAHMKAHFEEVEINEMDSEGYRGHRGDEDPGKGPAKYVKPVTTKKTQDDAAKVLAKSFEKDKVKKEEVVIEGAKEDAEKLLGGPVKTRTGNEPKGKLPLGFRQARNLARRAMKAGKSVTESTAEVTEVNEMSHGKALAKMIMAKQSKHPIAQHMGEEQDREYDYEGDMAKSQLKSVITNAQKLHDMLEDDTNLPEWVQLKITLAEDYIVTAANYMDGELDEEVSIDEPHMTDAQMARREKLVKSMKSADWEKRYPGRGEKVMYATATKMAMKEEVEQTDEIYEPYGTRKLRRDMKTAARMAAHDAAQPPFVEPEWLTKERAAAKERERAKQAAEKKKTNEEVEQIGEQSPSEIKAKHYHDQFDKVKPVKAYDKEGKLVGHYRSMAHAKQMKPGHTYKMAEEVVTEAEGSIPTTPKEKELAAHHGDPNRITFGDVLKARLKSAAAKKMGK